MHRASRLLWPVAGVLLVLLVAGCGSKSGSGSNGPGENATYTFTSTLNNAQAVPKPKGAANGSGNLTGKITITGQDGTIEWTLSYKGLSGKPVAAQMFLGAPKKTGPSAVDLCPPCKPVTRGSLGANVALLDALVSRQTYVTVQTKKNPGGEIRGRVVVKPTG